MPTRTRSVFLIASVSIQRNDYRLARNREDFLQWLSTHPSETSHDQTYSKKHAGTGDWLLCHPSFEHWMRSKDSAVLWCYGKR